MYNEYTKYIINWLNLSLIIIVLMVVVGGITRLTHSGLSISDWRPITGLVPPLSDEEWSNVFDEYKKYPEYNKLNFNMTILQYKTIYYWEYFHRLLGRMIGLLFLIPFIYFYYRNFLNRQLIKKLLVLFLLGAVQGVMGWYMVSSGLVNDPYISHYRLAAHLIIAFIILAYIHWIKLSLTNRNKRRVVDFKYFNKFINIIICLFFIQITYGAFTAGLRAGQFWNTFPLIEGRIIPEGLLSFKPTYLNFLENGKAIQFIHRYLGLLLMSLIYFLSFKMKDINSNFYLKSRNLVTIVTCQVFLGIIALISKVPIVLGVSHQFLAIFLLLLLLNTKYSLKYDS